MRRHPFSIFKPYVDEIDIRFFDKSDCLTSDDDLAVALKSDQLCTLTQVHGALTVAADTPERRVREADGMITHMHDLWLGIRIADCQPMVIYAPRRGVGGLLHVGWRGLRGGAIPAFFTELQHTHGIRAEETIVGVGPSLCTNCAEFTDPTVELAGCNPAFIHGKNVDLRSIADQQLLDWGVKKQFLERSPDCTKCSSNLYWSYRAEPDMVKKGNHNVLAMRMM